MSFTYILHDLCLESAFEFPELLFCGMNEVRANVRVGFGDTIWPSAPQLKTVDGFTLLDGSVFIDVPHVARFMIADGFSITTSPYWDASMEAVRSHLIGQAVPCLLHQLGKFPLHASAVATPWGAIAFSGDSGYGKSTLAAQFARHGFPMLSDDELVIARDGSGEMMAWPSVPMANFTAETAKFLGFDRAAQCGNYAKFGKFPYRQYRHHGEPVPFRQLFCLEWAEEGDGAVDIRQVEGFEAFQRLRRSVLYRDLVGHFAGEAAFTQWAEGVLKQAEVFVLRRPADYTQSQSVLDDILAILKQRWS